MAKKLKWGSFTQEDLVVNHEDDIYLDFLLLRMKKDGMGMEKARNFRFSKNNVRGTGKTDASKVVSLSGSFFMVGIEHLGQYLMFVEVKIRTHLIEDIRSVC